MHVLGSFLYISFSARHRKKPPGLGGLDFVSRPFRGLLYLLFFQSSCESCLELCLMLITLAYGIFFSLAASEDSRDAQAMIKKILIFYQYSATWAKQ
jgi:hypothetical protein